jgi:hypothetical protein
LLEWNKKNPVDLSSDLKMPQFTMGSVITDNCEESSLIGKGLFTRNTNLVSWRMYGTNWSYVKFT